MDVVTELRARLHPDPGRQAGARPGPPAQRPPVLAEHPGHQGDDHPGPRSHVRAHPGLRADATRAPRRRSCRGHRHARDPPDRHARRLRHDRQRRRPDAAPDHHQGRRRERQADLAARRPRSPRASRSSARRPPTSSPTSWPATPRSKTSTRTGASWRSTQDGVRRPAAYKTGTTSDNVDVHAYGYLAPPKDKDGPALAVGVWMGNSNNDPNKGSLSLDSSAPLWSAHPRGGQPKYADRQVQGARRASRPPRSTRSPASSPGRSRRRPSRSCSSRARSRPQRETIRVSLEVDEASGLLWRDGCVGPKVTKGFFDLREVESNFPNWQKANRNWAARAAKGPGRRGGPRGHQDRVLLHDGPSPVRQVVGCAVRADRRTARSPRRRDAIADPSCDPLPPTRSRASRRPTRPERVGRRTGNGGGVDQADEDAEALTAGAVRAQKLTIVAPSPPSPRSPGRDRADQRMRRGRLADGIAQGAGAEPVDDRDRAEAGQARIVEVAVERLEGLLDPGTAQVQRGRDAARPIQPQRRGIRVARRADAPRPAAPTAAAGRAPAPGRRARPRRACRRPPGSPAGRPCRGRRCGPPSHPSGCAPGRRPATSRGSRSAAARAGRPRLPGSRSAMASARLTAASSDAGGDRLALERPARRGELARRSSTTRSASSRAARTCSSRSRRARRRSSSAVRSASAARSSAARARSRASLVSPSVALIGGQGRLERALRLGQARSRVLDDRLRAGPAARRSRTPGCRRAARSSGGRSATASRGRTRPPRCAPRASCARTP